MVTFPGKEITPLGQYQIMLLGDRGTQVQVACPRPQHNIANINHTGLSLKRKRLYKYALVSSSMLNDRPGASDATGSFPC